MKVGARHLRSMQFIDPRMPKRIDRWRSPALGIEMPIVTYGFAGQPVLLFPTAAADFLENERFFLVKAVEPLIATGRLRLFSIDSPNPTIGTLTALADALGLELVPQRRKAG